MLTVRQVHCFWQPNKSWYEINGFHRSMHCIYTVCEIWLHIVCPQMVRSMNSVDWIEYDWMHTNGWPSISIFIRMQSTLAKWIFAPFNPTNRYCTHTQFNFYTHCVFAQARGLHVCSSLHMQQQQDVYPFSTFFCFLFFFISTANMEYNSLLLNAVDRMTTMTNCVCIFCIQILRTEWN